MFHSVRPDPGRAYAPNHALEITPEFLDTTLSLLAELDYDIVPVGDLTDRLAREDGRRFAVLTFDDGYRDNLEYAAPILRRHRAPYAIYVTTGFVERTARLWWLELEAAIGALNHVEMEIAGRTFSAPARTKAEKDEAYVRAYSFLTEHDEPAMLDQISALVERSGVAANFTDLCMTWDEVRTVAADPLCTIGVHTLTHARLAKHSDEYVRTEMLASKDLIEEQLGRSALHLAYPFGDRYSAGSREFQIARACGFETALTTRPGVLFAAHRDHLTALPRLAVHGSWQQARTLETLLSGAPFALWNLGRRLNVS